MTEAFSPPLTDRSPLISLSGWVLVMRCPTCGIKERAVDDMLGSLRGSKPIGELVAKLTCDKCRQPPISIGARCAWVTKFRPGTVLTISLSDMLPASKAA